MMRAACGRVGVWLVAAGAMGVPGPAARADVALLTQARSATARSYDFSTIPFPTLYEESWAATDFSPGLARLYPYGGMGVAEHASVLTPTLITASGTAVGVRGFQTYHGRGEVDVAIGFRVDSAMLYHLSGLWGLTPYTGDADFALTGPGVDWRAGKDTAAGIFDGTFDVVGVLSPGDYMLTAYIRGANGGVAIPTGSAYFDMRLEVPGPGAIPVCCGAAAAGVVRRRR